MAGAASEAGTCSERDAADGVAGCVKGRSRCGAALALVPPLCATARPLCAARPDRAASLPLPTDTPPCAAVWRKRENRRPQNVQVNRGVETSAGYSAGVASAPPHGKHRPAERGGDVRAGVIFHPLGSIRGSAFTKSPPLPVFRGISVGIYTNFRRSIMPREKIQVRAASFP